MKTIDRSRRQFYSLLHLALEELLSLPFVDVIDANIGTDDTAHNGRICVCITAKECRLAYGPVVGLIEALFPAAHQSVHGQHEGVLHEAHQLLRVVDIYVKVLAYDAMFLPLFDSLNKILGNLKELAND